MTMTLAVPNATWPRIGNGCEVAVQNMTTPVAGEFLEIDLMDVGHSVIFAYGGIRLPSTATTQLVVVGYLGEGYFGAPAHFAKGNHFGSADGVTIDVKLTHWSASFSARETTFIGSFIFDPNSFMDGLFRQLEIKLSTTSSDLSVLAAEIDAIRNAVLHEYSNA